MTFDEQLKQAFDTLADRLRDDIARQVQPVVDELAVSAQGERDRAAADARAEAERDGNDRTAAAVAAAEARGREQVQDAETRAGEIARAAEARAREQGLDEGRAQGEQEGRDRGRQEGQQAADERGREALAALAAAHADSQSSDAASRDRLVEAVRSIGAARSLSEILETLVRCVGRDAARAGVLLIRDGGAFGWRFVGFDPPLDHAGPLDLRLDQAGIIADAARTNAAVFGDGAGAPSFLALPPGRQCLAAPLALCGEVVAVLYADQGSTGPESPVANHVIEVLTRHAARCLEATTAFKTARALAEHAKRRAPVAPARGDDAAPDDAAPDGDVAARRYARLLVSEIKLYHEAAVVDGRRERDLAARLGAEMARARMLYEQRVPPQVRQHADYFRDELVRTLANGDASLLGS